MDKLLSFLGFIWTLPNSIIGWCLLSILYLCKQIYSIDIDKDFIFCWNVKSNSWFCKKMLGGQGWGGFCIGNNIVITDLLSINKYGKTFLHEREHIYQLYLLGIFFYPAYVLDSIRIYLFESDLHPYYDNWFEVKARIAAGQPAFIPKSDWNDLDSRWIWWE